MLGELDPADTVGQRVVHFHHQRRSAIGEVFYERELPERTGHIEGGHARSGCKAEHFVEGVRCRGGHAAQMPAEVEVRIGDTAQRTEPQRRLNEPVSYTHLDVYKRQQHSKTSGTKRAPGRSADRARGPQHRYPPSDLASAVA